MVDTSTVATMLFLFRFRWTLQGAFTVTLTVSWDRLATVSPRSLSTRLLVIWTGTL